MPQTNFWFLPTILPFYHPGVLYAFIFGQVTNVISLIQRNSNEFKDQLDDIKNFNGTYNMPRGVGARLEEYFRATWAVTNGIHEDKVGT